MTARLIARSLVLTTAVLALTAGAAGAQQATNPNVSIAGRPRPDFDPLGIRLGSYLLYPQLSVSEVYDDNIYATTDDEQDDFATIFAPRVDLFSNFNNHALNFSVGGEGGLYYQEDNNNYVDLFAEADGRLDVTRQINITGNAGVARQHESRDDEDNQIGADEDLTEFYDYVGALSLNQRFNRLRYSVTGQANYQDFENSGDIDNNDRDYITYSPSLEVGYLISPRLDAFVRGTYFATSYDRNPDNSGINRESDGYEIAVGTNVDITSIIFGEVFVGYQERDYDDEIFDDPSGISFGAGLTWNVTQLTTISFDGQRQVRDSSSRADSGGNFQTTLGVRADHELRRNVLVNGRLAYKRDEYDTSDDDTYSAGVGASYLLNRNLSLSANYTYSDRSSDLEQREYSRNVVLLSLTGKL